MKKITLTEGLRSIIGRLDEINTSQDVRMKSTNTSTEEPETIEYSDGNYDILRKPNPNSLSGAYWSFKVTKPNGDFVFIRTKKDGQLTDVTEYLGGGHHDSESWSRDWVPGKLRIRPGNKKDNEGTEIVYKIDPKAANGVSISGKGYGTWESHFNDELQDQSRKLAKKYSRMMDKNGPPSELSDPMTMFDPPPELRYPKK